MAHKNYRKETNCLNCGALVEKRFCPECGQENLDVHENFFHLVGHFISDYFHFDSKFFRSLIPLFFRPGFLTKEYLEGRRVQYIHPLRLFFFVTIVSVLVTEQYYKRFENEVKSEYIHVTDTTAEGDKQIVPLDAVTGQTKVQVDQMAARLYDFFHHLKYIAFFLLPLYALVFKLLYLKKRAFYVDHLIYTLHVQSFVFCLSGLFLLIPLLVYPESRQYINPFVSTIMVLYIVLSLRYLYHESWVKTIFKSLVATFIVMVVTGSLLLAYIMT